MNKSESYLYLIKSWVPARDLAWVSECSERDLRGDHSEIKLCSISSNAGYKHVAHATDEEFNHYCARIRAHARAELERVNKLEEVRTSQRQELLKI